VLLGLQKRVETILLCCREKCIQTEIAAESSNNQPERNPEILSAVAKLLKRLNETGSVTDKPHSEREVYQQTFNK
jgi:hypothetical protein